MSSNNDDVFRNIDTEPKAYLLGWIAASDRFVHTSDVIAVRAPYELVQTFAETLQDVESKSFIEIKSPVILEDVRRHLGVWNKLPQTFAANDNNKELMWHFIRGYFDATGSINPLVPQCSMHVPVLNDAIAEFAGISNGHNVPLRMTGSNCIDFLGKIYGACSPSNPHMSKAHYEQYQQCLVGVNVKINVPNTLPKCRVHRVNAAAVLPSKTNASDVGYDITVIKESKKLNGVVTLYDTGLQIDMQSGYYAEIVPRSSLSKSGFMLANSMGIIDPSYRGNLYIALARIDPDAPEPALPFRCCQMIVRPQIHVDIVECESGLDSTVRGIGGFGSTGV